MKIGVLIVADDASGQDLRRCLLDAGFDEHIHKPVTPQNSVTLIANHQPEPTRRSR